MTDDQDRGRIEGPEKPDPIVEPQKRPSLSDYGYTRSPEDGMTGGDKVSVVVVVVVVVGILFVLALVVQFIGNLTCTDTPGMC
jgi:hypothetical protein